MALHPQTAALLVVMEQFNAPALETQEPTVARAGMEMMTAPSTVELHEIREVNADGVAGRLYRPNDRKDLGLLVFYHGGGWVLGSMNTHDDVCRKLALAMGHAVLSVDYRLAPEFAFPEPLNDCIVTLRWAYANAAELGIDATRIAVGGDSAGGNLAAVVANLQPVPLKFQMLIYPVTDATRSSQSYKDNGEGYRLTAAGMKWFCDHYVSGSIGTPTDPRVSPLFADATTLASAPPAIVITAEYDPLRDEGEQYAHRLIEAGVACSLTRYYGQVHGFFSMSQYVDDGASAINQAATATRLALER